MSYICVIDKQLCLSSIMHCLADFWRNDSDDAVRAAVLHNCLLLRAGVPEAQRQGALQARLQEHPQGGGGSGAETKDQPDVDSHGDNIRCLLDAT